MKKDMNCYNFNGSHIWNLISHNGGAGAPARISEQNLVRLGQVVMSIWNLYWKCLKNALKFSKTFCFYAHGKDAQFISVQKILADLSANKDREKYLFEILSLAWKFKKIGLCHKLCGLCDFFRVFNKDVVF